VYRLLGAAWYCERSRHVRCLDHFVASVQPLLNSSLWRSRGKSLTALDARPVFKYLYKSVYSDKIILHDQSSRGALA
jgi:hypothetical protein